LRPQPRVAVVAGAPTGEAAGALLLLRGDLYFREQLAAGGHR